MNVGEDHWLVGPARKPAADVGGRMSGPALGLVHYTAGSTLTGAESTLLAKDDTYVSAHVGIARDGTVRQYVPFDRVAYHAGVSKWGERTGLNACAIGIELVNPGWYRAGFSVEWPVLTATHRNGGPRRDWYLYPPEQIDALLRVMDALRTRYRLTEWVGHDHVSPLRKWDPGPAFPWSRVRAAGYTAPER